MLREQGRGASACAAHCCALVVRTWEENPEHLRLENGPRISARALHRAQSAATIQDAVGFPQRLSSGAQEKDPRPLPGASDQLTSLLWIIRNLGSGTQKPVPRLRDRMQERSARTQAGKCRWLCISCETRIIVVQIKRKNWALRRIENCRLNRVLKNSQKQIPHPTEVGSERQEQKGLCVGAPISAFLYGRIGVLRLLAALVAQDDSIGVILHSRAR